MPSKIDINQLEAGTVVVKCTFYDEEGNLVTPNSLSYTLKDIEGNVVNSKSDVSITSDTSVNIVLSGDDLPYGRLYVVISGTYDSTYGTGLNLHDYTQLHLMEAP